MFSRVATLFPIVALAAVAAAAPNGLAARGSTCSTGTVNCCTQQFSGSTPFSSGGESGGLVTAVVDAVLNVGLTCTPITVLGLASGAQCTSQAACCTNVKQTGLVNIACTPIAAAIA